MELRELRDSHRIPKSAAGYASARSYTEMQRYAHRLECSIIESKGITLYAETECEVPPIQKVTRRQRSAS